jgi:hypothetical protein
MEKEWLKFREDKWETGVAEETQALREAMEHFQEFGLVGGLLRKKGEIVAFTIGEPLNSETMVVHFEKAYPDLQGAYPMINQQFVLHECEDFRYVNREEDTGDMGLRKAKLSYHPEILLKKYCGVESEIVLADESQKNQIAELWEICFGDQPEYIQMYLEHRFRNKNMLVIWKDGKIVSMASLLPASMKLGEEWISVRYVYAVATHPQYRGRGYAARILEHALEKYGEPLILQPADESLEVYYEKLGFRSCFIKETKHWNMESAETKPEEIKPEEIKLEEIKPEEIKSEEFKSEEIKPEEIKPEEIKLEEIKPEEIKSEEIKPEEIKLEEFKSEEFKSEEISEITAEQYKKIRDSHFTKDGYIKWKENAIAYALMENQYCRGRAVKTQEEELLLYRQEKEQIRVMETTLTWEKLRDTLKSQGITEAYYENGGGMICYPQNWDKPRLHTAGYLNLTLG